MVPAVVFLRPRTFCMPERREETRRSERAISKWKANLPAHSVVELAVRCGARIGDTATSSKLDSVDACEAAFDSLSLSYRHSPTYVTDRNSLFVWLRLGEMEAESIECVEYDKTVFLKSLAQIRSLTLESIEVFLPKIQRLCAKAGVAFVITKPVGKMSLSGVSRWLSPRKAMIQQTLRHKANDHFWFTFFHEARHVLHGSRKTVFVDGTGLEGASPEEEEEANAWSAEFLVPQAQLLKFVAAGDLSERAVRSFANELGIAAGIVVGQLQKRNYLRYGQLSSLIERFEWT
jgi:HTH-type transcriptional regulator / antitoxin HigA